MVARSRAGRPGLRRRDPVAAVLVVLLVAGLVAVAGCSISASGAAVAPTGVRAKTGMEHAVGVRTEALVTSRPSPSDAATKVDASLVTTVFYPATGSGGGPAVADAPANRRGGPYPLIVFAHGLGANPEAYRGLLERWAAAGYVVAAPAFPRTSSGAVGGIDPGDFTRQPADVRRVVTELLRDSGRRRGPWRAMVARSGVGVAGHSLGGITTLGVAANTCCRDERIKAAVVMSGDPLTFPKGHFAYAKAPPILLVHGTDDDLVTYEASVDVFNRARAPKGVLTIKGGDHGAPMDPTGPAFDAVAGTTTAFFDRYLKDDAKALRRLRRAGRSTETRVVFAAGRGSTVTLPTTPTSAPRQLRASVTPDSGLRAGQTVTVKWSGFTPGKTINIVQCSNRTAGDASACDLKTGKILYPNPTGSGSLPMEIVVGPVGNGICDSTTDDCQFVFNDGGSLDPSASVRVSISFAPS